MKAAIVRTTIDRKTGQKLREGIIGYEEIDEDIFYRPLVEVLGKQVLEALQSKQEGGLAGSEEGGVLEGTERISNSYCTWKGVNMELRRYAVTSIETPDVHRV